MTEKKKTLSRSMESLNNEIEKDSVINRDSLDTELLNIPYQTNQRNKMINIDLDVNNLATGQYIYKLVFENIKQSGKFIIVK